MATSSSTSDRLPIAFQSPPRPYLNIFNRSLPASEQDLSIPQIFIDALTVREQVFVKEQKAVPLIHHTDTDDARSCHWVIYSLSLSSASKDRGEELITSPKPIGTIRLVPSPHPPHPKPGSHFDVPPDESIPSASAESVFFAADPKWEKDRKTSLHDGVEAYVKLGRLCVLREERGRKVADFLIQEALRWVGENYDSEHEGNGKGGEWKGLVCVHAQEGAVKTWERNGFIVDEEMGSWFEAGKKHVGMFVRVEVKRIQKR